MWREIGHFFAFSQDCYSTLYSHLYTEFLSYLNFRVGWLFVISYWKKLTILEIADLPSSHLLTKSNLYDLQASIKYQSIIIKRCLPLHLFAILFPLSLIDWSIDYPKGFEVKVDFSIDSSFLYQKETTKGSGGLTQTKKHKTSYYYPSDGRITTLRNTTHLDENNNNNKQ